MSKARVRLPPGMVGLLQSDWERITREANMGTEDTDMATRYYIDQIPQADIAEELGMDRATISKRLKKILTRLEETARKLKICKGTESEQKDNT